MDKEKQGRKQNVTEGDGSVKVNKDERVSGSVGGGSSKNPAGKKPTAAQGNKTPGSVQGVAQNGGKPADDAEKGLVGDIAGSVLTNVVSNAIGGGSNQSSGSNGLLGTVLGAAAGSAASNTKRKGGSKLLKLILLIIVAFIAFKLLKSCLGGGGYNPIEESKPYWNDSVYVESQEQSSQLPDVVVTGEPRKYYTKLNGGGNETVTIMIYMCGADLESKYGLATADLNEICSATISDKVNIIVETGGAGKWQNSIISNRTTQRYKVVKGGVQKLQDLGSQKQMTDPNTLLDFISYCSQNFPANRNILIFWDHGGGSVSGYGYDENYTSRGTMTLDQVYSALQSSKVKFDIIGYDACLMACLENAFACEPFADYLLASEESEPGYGWYYTNWITQLSQNPSTPTETLAKTIIDDYISHCKTEARGSDATLSLIDLAKLKGYVPSYFNAFAASVSNLITGSNYSAVSQARGRAHEFAASSKIDQVDLIDFATRLNTVEGRALVTALNKCIAYNKANISGAYGISVYFPYKRTNYVTTAANLYTKIGIDNAYTTCIRNMASAMSGGQIVSNGSGSALGSLTGNLFDSYGYSDSSSISSGTVSDLLGSFFGSGSSSGALGDLLGSYQSSGLDNNYSYGANDSLYNSLMGSSQSGNYSYGSGSSPSSSYGTYGSLFSSLLGGSSNQSSSSGSDLTSALLSSFFGRDTSSRMIEMTDYYAANYLDAGRLIATEKGKGYVLTLTDEEWDLVTDCALNVFIDDGEGYVDLGIDNLYEFDKDGDLKLDFKGTWLAVNGQIVSYYFVGQDEDTNVTTGYVPCLWNGKRANLVFSFNALGKGEFLGVRFLYENETSMETKGYITPDQKRLLTDEDFSEIAEGELLLQKGAVIKFLCDYYNYDGTFESAYVLGDPLVYDGSLRISDVKLKLDDNQSALVTYRLTDIYNNNFWTESLEY